jgi:twitching motility protein PilI
MIQEYCRLKISPSLRIAIPVSYVDEIIQLRSQDISPIPGVQPALLGITNQRGKLLWVLNMEHFLGLKPSPLGKPIVAIAIRDQIGDMGIRRLACVVMAIEEIVTLDSQKFLPIPKNLPPRAQALLSSLVRVDDNIYGLLNVNEVFRLLNPDVGDRTSIAEFASISTA